MFVYLTFKKKSNIFNIFKFFSDHCIRDRGRFYQGTVNVTKSGIPCQRWDSQVS